jgi:hypothetical protein
MDVVQSGRQCTQNVAALYEQSLRDRIDHRNWNAWIHAQLTAATPPVPRATTRR